ncbi:uncharacterized protein DNG_10293 [Cephalotrichum gorgonifer]|uniref:Uncharacterized protein n=1 Tax=Cephalotrichum gorgonifer TaxID=2041049 RepID=A0AAE8N8W9_9PEZI|nr:uncharacterized protein DNG_10293 [Cephalotrichum gorgonifer]
MSNDSACTVTIHLPNWLTGAIWRFWMRKTCWDLRVRQYNIRSEEAEIFASVRDGDVEKMLLLFERRDASPFDRDANGKSLLYYAAAFHQPTICKRLLDMGLHDCVDEDPGNGVTPREAAYLRSLWPTDDGKGHRDIVELFLDPGRIFPEPEDCRFLLYWCSWGPVDVATVRQFQKEVAPDYFSLLPEQRLQAARAYCLSGRCGHHPDATVFTFLIGRDIDTNYILDTDDACSLVHSIAIAFGRTHRQAMEWPTERNAEREFRWFHLLSRVLKRSQQTLHVVEHVGYQYSIDVGNLICEGGWVGTPLLSMLRGSVAQAFWVGDTKSKPFKKLWEEWQSVLASALGHWLTDLVELGVDLERLDRRCAKPTNVSSKIRPPYRVSTQFSAN